MSINSVDDIKKPVWQNKITVKTVSVIKLSLCSGIKCIDVSVDSYWISGFWKPQLQESLIYHSRLLAVLINFVVVSFCECKRHCIYTKVREIWSRWKRCCMQCSMVPRHYRKSNWMMVECASPTAPPDTQFLSKQEAGLLRKTFHFAEKHVKCLLGETAVCQNFKLSASEFLSDLEVTLLKFLGAFSEFTRKFLEISGKKWIRSGTCFLFSKNLSKFFWIYLVLSWNLLLLKFLWP